MKSSRKRLKFFLLTAAVLAGAFLLLRALLTPAIQVVHTNFLFSQLDTEYRESIVAGQLPVATSREFIARIPQWQVDWNSCSLQAETVYDSWNTPIEIRVSHTQIDLRSAGLDRAFNTADDLAYPISNTAN